MQQYQIKNRPNFKGQSLAISQSIISNITNDSTIM